MARPRSISLELTSLLERGGLYTTERLEELGFSRLIVWRNVREGKIIQFARGIFCAATALSEHGIGLAALTLFNPGAVVCLISAARFHDLSNEDPPSVWMAVDGSRFKKPLKTDDGIPAQTVWWRPEYLATGIETRTLAGVPVRLTDPARTVVDLVRYRLKLGDEPAMKALHDYVRSGAPIGDLWDRAKDIGFLTSMEPFIRAAEEFKESIPARGK